MDLYLQGELEPSFSSEPARQSFTMMNVSQFRFMLVCTESESAAEDMTCFFQEQLTRSLVRKGEYKKLCN